MPKFKLPIAAAVAAIALAGCAAPSKRTGASASALENQLVGALLAAAEREGQVSKVLLAPGLPAGIRSALASRRSTVAAQSDAIEGLAKGQLLVQSASLEQSQATLTARLGPVPRPKPNVALLACGTGLTVTFNLVGGQWQQGDLQILNC